MPHSHFGITLLQINVKTTQGSNGKYLKSLCPIVLQNAIRVQHMLPNQRAAGDHKKLAKLFFPFKKDMV